MGTKTAPGISGNSNDFVHAPGRGKQRPYDGVSGISERQTRKKPDFHSKKRICPSGPMKGRIHGF